MNILVMGGTLFLGRVLVEHALADGHTVTLCNRGKTNPGLFPDVEQVTADRNVDLSELAGRSFDAVIDTSAYFPTQVESVVDVLGEIGHYCFVSSCSVYADHSIIGVDEDSPLIELEDPTNEELTSPDAYGGFKALCEEALHRLLPGRVHSVRAGLIVGPHDNTGRFTYWVERIAEGGQVLAPEPRDQPVQFIDVHDLADWMLLAAATGVSGNLNASSPAGQLTMEAVLTALVATLNPEAELVWTTEEFLVEQGVDPWSELPLWLPPGALPTHVGFMSRSTVAAAEHGLTTRAVTETVLATKQWLDSGGEIPEKDFGNAPQPTLSRDRERQLLAEAPRQ